MSVNASILSIESKNNQSFGTGFVIYNDKKGSYIITASHVIDEVEVPMIENREVEVIVQKTFSDLALLYLEGIFLEPLPLQISHCSGEVKIIGFSCFAKKSVQKMTLKGRIQEEFIEVQSKENEASTLVRKIFADKDFHFERGNSGSPVFCTETNKVIAMVGYKEKNSVAFAMDIASVQNISKEIPQEIFQNHQGEKKKRRWLYYLFVVPALITVIYVVMSSLLLAFLRIFQV